MIKTPDRIKTWDELMKCLEGSEDGPLTDNTYRGVSYDYKKTNLWTSLQLIPHKDNLHIKEQKFLNAFRKHARAELRFGLSDWDVMLLGQHHGLPTRLLDWTVSPPVVGGRSLLVNLKPFI